MLPMRAVRLRLGTLLAGDVQTLAPATSGNLMHLIGAAFALTENLTVADLTLLSGNGLDPIPCATGPQESALDPITQEQIVTIVPGGGTGFRWVTSGNLAAPITVYGVALTDGAGETLLAAQNVPMPISLSDAGYQVDFDPQTITLLLTPTA